jgi:hypothetical protein
MQDRYRRIDKILLRRTAGPYIRVIRDPLCTQVIAAPRLVANGMATLREAMAEASRIVLGGLNRAPTFAL